MQLSSTMSSKKPPGNSPPGDESPNDDDGAPPEDTLGDPPMSENKRVARLEQNVKNERKKREKAERKVATEVLANKELRSDVKVLKAEHEIVLTLEKTKLAEHKARDAAALATKTEKLKAASVTTKALLGAKDFSLKESEKKRSQLEKEVERQSKQLKKAAEEIQNLRTASKDIGLHKQQVKTLQGKVDRAKNADTMRADAKMAHAMSMAELKFKGEQLSYDREIKRKENQEERIKFEYSERSKLVEFSSRVRGQAKTQEDERQATEKKRKTDAAEARLALSHAAAQENRITMQNGGQFPRPGVSLREVSILFHSIPFIVAFC
jgi:hypothetical protein